MWNAFKIKCYEQPQYQCTKSCKGSAKCGKKHLEKYKWGKRNIK